MSGASKPPRVGRLFRVELKNHVNLSALLGEAPLNERRV